MNGGRCWKGFGYKVVTKGCLEALVLKVCDGGACKVLGWLLGDVMEVLEVLDLPIIGKPTEVRMGRGKGNPAGWIARVSTGQIPFEMDGVSLSNARQAATLAAHKLCVSTKFVQWS
ncbi:ribosomal protein L16 [Tanacetum coccineum]